MPRQVSAATLAKIINKLRSERRKLATQLAAIDATFTEIGISSEPLAHRTKDENVNSRPPRRGKYRRRRKSTPTQSPPPKKPRQVKETAKDFVLGLLDGKKLITAEINGAWKKTRRAGTADATLMNLVKAKKLARRKIRGGRGSRYWAV